jgi:hypothetical protein
MFMKSSLFGKLRDRTELAGAMAKEKLVKK